MALEKATEPRTHKQGDDLGARTPSLGLSIPPILLAAASEDIR